MNSGCPTTSLEKAIALPISKGVRSRSFKVVLLPCNMAFEELCMGRKCMGWNSTTWESGSTWNTGKTTLIRVPIALKDDILAYARAVDAKLINDQSHSVPSPKGDFLQFTMRLIDRYIEYERQNYHPNQNARVLDTSTRPWDKLRKFQKLVQQSPELLQD